MNWVSAILASVSALYIVVFYEELSFRIAMPSDLDLVVAFVGFVYWKVLGEQ